MKKFIFVLWLMIVSAEVMAQSFIIVDKNGIYEVLDTKEYRCEGQHKYE